MLTVLIILASCAAVAFGVSYAVKYFSYSEKETKEVLPVENYEVEKPTVKETAKPKRGRKPKAKK